VTDEELFAERLETIPLFRLVSLAGHVTYQRVGRAVGNLHGLTAAGSGVLSMLAWSGRGAADEAPGRATHAELARRCMISPATLTGVVDTLERAGYVRRERDAADRRVVWLVVTEAGQQRVAEIGKQVRDVVTPTRVEQDPAKEAVIREYLIEIIMQNHGRE
jgi:DNA-binding MarR family transcriptional regulator